MEGVVKEQRESGNYNASRIMAGNGVRGFTGSETIVRDTVAKWRKAGSHRLLLPSDFLQCPG